MSDKWQKIGIVGAGVMGVGIATVVAQQLKPVLIMWDSSAQALARGREKLAEALDKAVKKGQLEAAAREGILGRVILAESLNDLAEAELVIEAVVEDLAVKQELFANLSAIVSPGAILASNTSGLPITSIAAKAKGPERVVGAHFFNPPVVMKLIEIVRGYYTSDQVVEAIQSFGAAVGKETIVARDFTGFLTTRIGAALMHEAMCCYQEGVGSAEDIDKGVRLAYNYPVGPLRLIDMIGLDVALKVNEQLSQAYGERFLPPEVLRQLVRAGRLGVKTGHGFYDYGS